MPTLDRARNIQKHMGGDIYFDPTYQCYRVMEYNSPSLQRYSYILVEKCS